MRRIRHTTLGIGGAALIMSMAACGISTSGGPRAISPSQIPNVPSRASTTTTPIDFVPVTIVLLNLTNDSLPEAVLRAVPPQSDQLSTILRDLLLGPRGDEQRRGLFSAIPSTTKLISVSPNPNAAPASPPTTPVTVNLSTPFLLSSGLNQELEVQQVVYTVACALTPTTGSAQVRFEVDGVIQPVPIANGTSSSGPVTAANYGALDCTPPSSG